MTLRQLGADVLLITMLAARTGRGAPPPADVDVAVFMPMGVYWPGEYLFATNGSPDWPRNEAALDDLARHNVNAV